MIWVDGWSLPMARANAPSALRASLSPLLSMLPLAFSIISRIIISANCQRVKRFLFRPRSVLFNLKPSTSSRIAAAPHFIQNFLDLSNDPLAALVLCIHSMNFKMVHQRICELCSILDRALCTGDTQPSKLSSSMTIGRPPAPPLVKPRGSRRWCSQEHQNEDDLTMMPPCACAFLLTCQSFADACRHALSDHNADNHAIVIKFSKPPPCGIAQH